MAKGTLYLIPSYLAAGVPANHVFPEYNGEIIRQIDYFLVEDIRSARRFISSLNLGLVIEDLTFKELNKKTPDKYISSLMRPLLKGKNGGIISEAGLPGVADPGANAVKFAHKSGIVVKPLVGPSSIILALMASGLNGQNFIFHGYLPIERDKREQSIKDIERESQKTGRSQIFMETPYRNNQLMESLVNTCHNDSLLSITAIATSPEEFIKTKRISMWKGNLPDLHKIPAIFILQR